MKQHWLLRPKTIRKLWIGGCLMLAALVAAGSAAVAVAVAMIPILSRRRRRFLGPAFLWGRTSLTQVG